MTQFLWVAAPLMGIVSGLLLWVGLVPSIRQYEKAADVLAGVSAFITTIAFGALAAFEISWITLFATIFWFLMASMIFARLVWFKK